MDQFHRKLLLPQTTIPSVKSPTALINGKVAEFDIQSYAGNYVVMVFLTGANHPVSESILASFSKCAPEFEEAGCKILALTTEDMLTVEMWCNEMGLQEAVPIIADHSAQIVRSFGLLHRDNRSGLTVNSVMIVDDNRKVRYTSILEPTVNQHPEEILHILKEFQATDAGDKLVMAGCQLIDNTISGIKDFYKTKCGSPEEDADPEEKLVKSSKEKSAAKEESILDLPDDKTASRASSGDEKTASRVFSGKEKTDSRVFSGVQKTASKASSGDKKKVPQMKIVA